ncbi:ATP-binding protein [Hwanghaeella grinnelliae]|uniref:endopeptidase La n=1 Tax=Hwanghaeella grinnelliae TaxID=2500179 RepID=A0A3S2W8K5_9PROT|nr:ATP-binding protein [Hwanghaeella grinnelliae]RVU35851.1 ATP-binding protein [Hwanghaeella grinnelliae]
MASRELPAEQVGIPKFDPNGTATGTLFELSSHERAREALETGLTLDAPGFNIFVVGEDRSGRMTQTLAFLTEFLKDKPVPDDWVYLNNFRRSHRPKPVRLPPGVGRAFRDAMARTIPNLRDALVQAFGGEEFTTAMERAGKEVHDKIEEEVDALRQDAREHGLTILQTSNGLMVAALDEEEKPIGIDKLPEDRRVAVQEEAQRIGSILGDILRRAAVMQGELAENIQQLRRQAADHAVGAMLEGLHTEFSKYGGLNRWLITLREDILDNLALFFPQQPAMPGVPVEQREPPERRYMVNLLVDHGDDKECLPVLEANPFYENLFGRIEYRSTGGYLDTDFTLIRAGALHKANGSILVLRAEAIGIHPISWSFLKGALRDSEIRIEEQHRQGGVQITGSPNPKPIPLDVKVVIVGAPRWYYAFFSIDPEFRTHFKVKADIDPDMDATDQNLAALSSVIRETAMRVGASAIEDEAVQRLLGQSSRWAGDRTKITAQAEIVEDVLTEAVHLASRADGVITSDLLKKAVARRRRRNARVEDRLQEQVHRKTIMIDTDGAVVGQVNGLTVRDVGDHTFGSASRITARASIGRRGVINIERDVEMSGPIQQKGAMVLHGYLTGVFARTRPVSFNCSITFEQNYGGVEGDSASLAELIAIISDLSDLPARQDLAITGSVNQRGMAQAIGGAHHKIEGFYRTCKENGLTGKQGVVIPRANERNLVLRSEVGEAVADGTFHIYSVDTIEDALALFLGMPVGVRAVDGTYPAETVYGRVQATLAEFDRILVRSRHDQSDAAD